MFFYKIILLTTLKLIFIQQIQIHHYLNSHIGNILATAQKKKSIETLQKS